MEKIDKLIIIFIGLACYFSLSFVTKDLVISILASTNLTMFGFLYFKLCEIENKIKR